MSDEFDGLVALADVHASLERAADVLSTVKGSQAWGTSGRQAAGARLGRRAKLSVSDPLSANHPWTRSPVFGQRKTRVAMLKPGPVRRLCI
jgi:hypothetical protein